MRIGENFLSIGVDLIPPPSHDLIKNAKKASGSDGKGIAPFSLHQSTYWP